MNNIELRELVGGALQDKFQKSFERVIENLQDVNTPYKAKRNITIKLSFEQNEARNDVQVGIDVVEKLAPQAPIKTAFYVGKDLKTGQLIAEEYGKQIKGQMSLNDYAPEQVIDGKVVDTDTGEIISDKVIDLRQAK